MTAQSTKQFNTPKGFTLIELLVTIAIIAIISVVAVALFGNVQANARDGKRRAELESIANVLEVNKGSIGYSAINCSSFGGGICPGQSLTTATMAIDPQNIPYCINLTGAADPSAAIAGWVASATTATVAGTCPASFAAIANGAPSTNPTQYKLCTRLETGGGTVFCRTNTQ